MDSEGQSVGRRKRREKPPGAARFAAHSGHGANGATRMDEGTLELVEVPYIIVYEVHDDREEIEIVSIVHGAQDR